MPPPTDASAAARLVLLVDDDSRFVANLSAILSAANYIVIGANNGRAAQKLLDQHRLDIALAIIDLFLPDINGFELIGMIAKHSPRPRIVAVSVVKRAVLESATALGADAVVQKATAGSTLDTDQWLHVVAEQIGPAPRPATATP